MKGGAYSDLEDVACLFLYLKHGRKQLYDDDPEVIELANSIGRSPTSVAYKLANFIFVDRGRGFQHISKTDRRVWEAYKDDYDSLRTIYDMIKSGSSTAKEMLHEELNIDEGDFYIPDSMGVAPIRAGTEKIRINALTNYNCKCAICGLDHPKLLISSHIVPWSADEHNRGDPGNVILLCPLHDKLFDLGFISISDDFSVIVSKALAGYDATSRTVMSIAGARLNVPAKYPPKLEYLQYHRQHVFKG